MSGGESDTVKPPKVPFNAKFLKKYNKEVEKVRKEIDIELKKHGP